MALLRYDFEFVASLLLYKTRLTHSLPFQIEKVLKKKLCTCIRRITYVLDIGVNRKQIHVLSR